MRQGIHEILTLEIYPIEVAHALSKAEHRGLIQPPLGARRLRGIFRYPAILHPYLPLLPRAFEIASAARHGVYDCLYVASAEREGCEVLAADQRMINNLGPNFPLITSPESMP